MSNILFRSAIISSLSAYAPLTSLLPTDKVSIGQDLKKGRQITPYVSVEIRPSLPLSDTIMSIKKTTVRISSHSTHPLKYMQIMDAIEGLAETVPYWDVSNSDIDNSYSKIIFRQTIDDDFDNNLDIFTDVLDVEFTWRKACQPQTVIDIEECPNLTDTRPSELGEC
jgi:hypothetical protein